MDKSKKRRIAYEVMILLGVLLVLCYITRVWPLILLILLGLITVALGLLFRSLQKPESVLPPPPLPALPPPVEPADDQDVLRLAFSVLERHITHAVVREYPNARWVWEQPFPMHRLVHGEPLTILLNSAGGYQRAWIAVENLRFLGLSFQDPAQTVVTASAPDMQQASELNQSETESSEPTRSETASIPVNYSLMAMEWVEDHIGYLNERCNEAIARDEAAFLIPASRLPERTAWEEIRQAMLRHDCMDAVILQDGISVTIPI